MKKFLKHTGFTLVIILVILFIFPFAFHTKIKSVVIDKIDENLNAEVYFRDFSISAFKHFPHITLTLTDLSVVGIHEFKNDTLVKHNKSKKEEFKDPTLSDVTINSEIKKGKFVMYPFTFQVGKFLTEVEGEQGLEDYSLNYLIKISVPPFNKLKIPMSITGTTDRPVINTGKGFNDSDFEKL